MLKKNIGYMETNKIIDDAWNKKELDMNQYNLTKDQKSGLPEFYNKIRNNMIRRDKGLDSVKSLVNKINSLKDNIQ